MLGNGRGLELQEEYDMMLQLVRNHMLRRDQGVQPIVLQVHQEGSENREQVTLVLGQVGGEPANPPVPDGMTEGSASVAPTSLMTELGPLLLQALALQLLIGEQQRRVAAPLEQEAIGQLRRMRLECDTLARLDESGQTICSICQEAFALHAEVYCLPCGHVFDVACMQNWLERTRTCPNCRFTLQDVEQQYKDAAKPAWWESGSVDAEAGGTKGGWTLCPSHSLSNIPEGRDERLQSASSRRHQRISPSVSSPIGCVMQRRRQQQEQGEGEAQQPSFESATRVVQYDERGIADIRGASILGGEIVYERVSGDNGSYERGHLEQPSRLTSVEDLSVEVSEVTPQSSSSASASTVSRQSGDCRVEVGTRRGEEGSHKRRGSHTTPVRRRTFLPPTVSMNRPVSPPVSSTATRTAHHLVGEEMPTRVPELVSCPIVRPGPPSPTGESMNPRSRFTLLQPITSASGNARHAIRALRGIHNEHEGANYQSLTDISSASTQDTGSVAPGHIDVSNRCRRGEFTPSAPREDSSQRRLAEFPQPRRDDDSEPHGAGQRENRSTLQPTVRGNQRKLGQYQSIFRGQSRRC